MSEDIGQIDTFITVLGDLFLSWLKRLVASRLQLRRGINPKSVCVKFFVEKATLGQNCRILRVFLRI